MKLFVIHRFKDRTKAKKKLKVIAQNLSIKLQPIFLKSSGNDEWKEKAKKSIDQAEAAIVFNPGSCEESANAKWEIDKVKDAGIEIIELSENGDSSAGESRLMSLYELEEEFDDCFSPDNKDAFELYKLMIESSENLIQRRQKENALFITATGSLFAIAGLLVNAGATNTGSIRILFGISIVGFFLCCLWGNLIDNYGKLNKAKFEVIGRLEKDYTTKIYSAEWVYLGKGLRPKKYKPFTSIEEPLPLLFGLLFGLLFAWLFV